MPGLKIGIIGATGLVGEELIDIIEHSSVDISECRLFTSERSCGTKISIHGCEYRTEQPNIDSANGLDYIFFCADIETSRTFIPIYSKKGAICIDNSSAYRLVPNVPLIIPEINSKNLNLNDHVIANPNCSTIIALMALYPLHKLFSLSGFCVSTYQAVSGVGKNGFRALKADEAGDHKLACEIFGEQIAYNVIPKIGDIDESGYSSEENKMQYESRKILGDDSLKISAMCVRVPVARVHSMSIFANFQKKFDKSAAIDAFRDDKYLDFYDDDNFPCTLRYSKRDKCGIGRLRIDSFLDNGASFWVCGDQIRRGAAMNAFKIMLLRESLSR